MATVPHGEERFNPHSGDVVECHATDCYDVAMQLLLVLLVPALAYADAIMPFEGECPPGSEIGVSNHSEACIPKRCEDDGACGAGATCVTLCTCRAEREFTSDGRIVYPEPVRREVEVSLCSPEGACAEGTVSSRKQCEPEDDTPAWDRAAHRWTAQPHRSTGCAGCDASGGGAGLALAFLALVAFALRRAQRPKG
jgi:uncharacterized protein (TIGR03382 family)